MRLITITIYLFIWSLKPHCVKADFTNRIARIEPESVDDGKLCDGQLCRKVFKLFLCDLFVREDEGSKPGRSELVDRDFRGFDRSVDRRLQHG